VPRPSRSTRTRSRRRNALGSRIATGSGLVGNRFAALGAVLYFLEWVAIAFLAEVPTDLLGERPDEIVAAYEGEARAVSLALGWFGLVLIGRVLFVIGVRKAVRDSTGSVDTPLLDWAVAAMAVSVAIEVASLSFMSAGAWLADNDAGTDAVVALDAAGSIMFVAALGPIAASVLATGVAMHRGLFPRWLAWLGTAAGVVLVVASLLVAAALGDDGDFGTWGEQPFAIGALLWWVWIVATSVILWRARPRATVAT
jgi:hypothetical protein